VCSNSRKWSTTSLPSAFKRHGARKSWQSNSKVVYIGAMWSKPVTYIEGLDANGGRASGRRAIIKRFSWAWVDLVDKLIRSERLCATSSDAEGGEDIFATTMFSNSMPCASSVHTRPRGKQKQVVVRVCFMELLD